MTLTLRRNLTRVLRTHLVLTLTSMSAMSKGVKANNRALSVLLLAIRNALSTVMVTLTRRVGTIMANTTPGNIFNLQVGPRQLLQGIRTDLIGITRRTSNDALAPFGLNMSSFINAINRRRNNRRRTGRSNRSRKHSPSSRQPLRRSTGRRRRGSQHRRRTTTRPQGDLVFNINMLRSLGSLFSNTLLLL